MYMLKTFIYVYATDIDDLRIKTYISDKYHLLFTRVDIYNGQIAFMNADKCIRNVSFTYADAYNVTCTTAATTDTYVPDIC